MVYVARSPHFETHNEGERVRMGDLVPEEEEPEAASVRVAEPRLELRMKVVT